MISAELEEPVRESASRATRLAADLCGDCAWYHALYPQLRLLDLAATPERQADFYLGAFRVLASAGDHLRVAITGTADTCMLAHLLCAYRQEGADPRVTIVDRCATPLRLCEWYAHRVAADVRTTTSDILRWETEERFNLVTTHAFIGMLPHARQAELIARWKGVLRPGGRLVTVARIDPDWSPDCPGFSPGQVEAFAELVASRARERGAALEMDPAALAEAARDYAVRMRSFPFAGREDLVALLESGGFELERLDLVRLSGNAAAGQSGPGTHRPGTFAHFVARRT